MEGLGMVVRLTTTLGLMAMLALLWGCASSDASTEEGPGSPGRATMAAPTGHPFAKISDGMSDLDVVKILGQPTTQNTYRTWKSWMPYFYGPDTTRTVYNYPGQGRVLFTRNQYSGNLKVIRVEYNPNL